MPVVFSVGAPKRYATSVHHSGRFFLDQFGVPYFLAQDQAGDVGFNLLPADMETFFSVRQSQGFRGTAMLLVSDEYFSGNNAQTFDGIDAFTGTTGGYPDLTTPNEDYWTRIDAAVAIGAAYGQTLELIPLVVNDFDGDTYGWSTAEANGATKCNTFGQFLGDRYKSYPNTILWRHSDDYTADNDTLVGAIRDGVASAYPGSLHTTEYTDGGQAYSYEANTYWQGHSQYNFVYPSSDNLAMWGIMQTAVAATSAQPAILGEAIFEGTAGWSDLVLRNQSYWATTTGLLGGCHYGDLFVTPFTNSGWQARLVETTSTEFMYWASLLQGLPWWTLVPDTGNAFLTGGYSSGTTLSTAALSADGTLGLVYAVSTNPVIDMAKMAGEVTARWYDPTAGTFASIGSFSNSGSHTFTLPSARGDSSNDYVLVLTA